jgi:hypothetical protein
MKVSRQLHAAAALPSEKIVVPIYEAGWAPEPACTFWGRRESPEIDGIRIPDSPARSIVTIVTELSWIHS